MLPARGPRSFSSTALKSLNIQSKTNTRICTLSDRGPKGCAAPVCKMDFHVGGKFLCCMRTPDGQEFWNAGEYHEIVPREKIVSCIYFSDSEGNKVEPAQLGIEHEAIEGANDVTLFEDLGDGQTKLTFIGNEPMERARESGQVEGWNEILDKVAAVVAGLTQAK
jgi:uncharacterized protein YndB with AHSA1/START domain